MKKQLAILFVAGIAIALVAVLGMRGGEAEAATPALTLDPETGLPAGSLVFRVEDHTCIVLPTHEMECFCPCTSEVCNTRVEIVPSLPAAAVINTTPVTSMVLTTGDIPVPWSEPGQEAEPEPYHDKDKPKGNNGLGNGEDPAPPGIDKQGKPQNDNPAVPGQPQYQGSGSDGEPNSKGKDNKNK